MSQKWLSLIYNGSLLISNVIQNKFKPRTNKTKTQTLANVAEQRCFKPLWCKFWIGLSIIFYDWWGLGPIDHPQTLVTIKFENQFNQSSRNSNQQKINQPELTKITAVRNLVLFFTATHSRVACLLLNLCYHPIIIIFNYYHFYEFVVEFSSTI